MKKYKVTSETGDKHPQINVNNDSNENKWGFRKMKYLEI